MMHAGIDLGGTAIKAGLVTENGEIVARGISETKAGRPVEELIRDMASCLEETAEKAGLSMREIQSVGIGIPGFADNRSGTGFACDNLSPDPIPFRDEFRKNLDIPVSLINDANAAAWGESRFGAGKGAESCVLLTLGTGVGCGIILGGKPLTGYLGRAGEAGHMVIARDGIPCYCGRRGCLEQYCSATAMVRAARLAAAGFPDSALGRMEKANPGQITAREVVDLARGGDLQAGTVFSEFARYLALAVDQLIKLLDPEVILIGGGVSHAGSFLLDAVKEQIPTGEMGNLRPLPRIDLARLGNDAGLIGAALADVFSGKETGT